MAQLVDTRDNMVECLIEEKNFLKYLLKLTIRNGFFDSIVAMRVPKDDPYNHKFKCDQYTEYLDFESTKNLYPTFSKKVYNYKEYSNLPKNCVLYTLDNVVHNGNLTHIYGYLDEENKTFVEFEYNLSDSLW